MSDQDKFNRDVFYSRWDWFWERNRLAPLVVVVLLMILIAVFPMILIAVFP